MARQHGYFAVNFVFLKYASHFLGFVVFSDLQMREKLTNTVGQVIFTHISKERVINGHMIGGGLWARACAWRDLGFADIPNNPFLFILSITNTVYILSTNSKTLFRDIIIISFCNCGLCP